MSYTKELGVSHHSAARFRNRHQCSVGIPPSTFTIRAYENGSRSEKLDTDPLVNQACSLKSDREKPALDFYSKNYHSREGEHFSTQYHTRASSTTSVEATRTRSITLIGRARARVVPEAQYYQASSPPITESSSNRQFQISYCNAPYFSHQLQQATMPTFRVLAVHCISIWRGWLHENTAGPTLSRKISRRAVSKPPRTVGKGRLHLASPEIHCRFLRT